jgi:hypothetical protein
VAQAYRSNARGDFALLAAQVEEPFKGEWDGRSNKDIRSLDVDTYLVEPVAVGVEEILHQVAGDVFLVPIDTPGGGHRAGQCPDHFQATEFEASEGAGGFWAGGGTLPMVGLHTSNVSGCSQRAVAHSEAMGLRLEACPSVCIQ